MKINWKLRIKNKAVLVAIILAVVAFVYQILGIVGVTPSISQSDITKVIGIIINLLVALGIVTDPTTEGVSDSAQAMEYIQPGVSSNVGDPTDAEDDAAVKGETYNTENEEDTGSAVEPGSPVIPGEKAVDTDDEGLTGNDLGK